MPKFTLDNSFRFYSQNETTTNFHSESIERLLQKLSSADWLPLYARDGLIQAYLLGWKKMLVKINDVLDDAMKKQAKNLSVNMCLAKLQILACDVQDLLDEFQTETFRRELMPEESTSQPSTSQQLNSRAMYRVKEVTARLQNISWQIALLGLKSRNVRRRLVPTSLLSVKDKLVHGLVSWVDSVAREEWTAELFDVDLLWYPNIEEEIVEMLQIGMDCVQRVPEQRPKMVDVVKMIEEIMYPS